MEPTFDSGPRVAPVYRRDLPGGGYVAIDVERERELTRTRVSVERRSKDERRDGHRPIVIAEAEGDERSAGFASLVDEVASVVGLVCHFNLLPR